MLSLLSFRTRILRIGPGLRLNLKRYLKLMRHATDPIVMAPYDVLPYRALLPISRIAG